MLDVDRLTKRFGDLTAVDGVSFHVRPGEIYGLLGPNGAGKTTTMSMVSGLLSPDSGVVRFDGADLATDPLGVKRELGIVPQETALYDDLTARENLEFWGALYGLSGADLDAGVDRALERVELTGRARDVVRTYSGGMKRRLNLALGLVHGPRLVLMDEPTVGIDAQARNSILDVIGEVARDGAAVLYTTHYLEEAERLCDRVGILDHGKILAEGTITELKRQAGEDDLVTVHGAFDPADVRARIEGLEGVRLLAADDGRLTLATGGDGQGAVTLLSRVLDGSIGVDAVSIRPPSLESLFLDLTGRELRD